MRNLFLFILILFNFGFTWQTLILPTITNNPPSAGVRAKVKLPGDNTGKFFVLYLPINYDEVHRWPMFVEWPGSGCSPDYCDDDGISTPNMGYALSGGSDWIFLVLPYINANNSDIDSFYWNAPAVAGNSDPVTTIAYAKLVLAYVKSTYFVDTLRMISSGHSRGSVGAALIGNYDDVIASTWAGYWFDGACMHTNSGFYNIPGKSDTSFNIRITDRPSMMVWGEYDNYPEIYLNWFNGLMNHYKYFHENILCPPWPHSEEKYLYDSALCYLGNKWMTEVTTKISGLIYTPKKGSAGEKIRLRATHGLRAAFTFKIDNIICEIDTFGRCDTTATIIIPAISNGIKNVNFVSFTADSLRSNDFEVIPLRKPIKNITVATRCQRIRANSNMVGCTSNFYRYCFDLSMLDSYIWDGIKNSFNLSIWDSTAGVRVTKLIKNLDTSMHTGLVYFTAPTQTSSDRVFQVEVSPEIIDIDSAKAITNSNIFMHFTYDEISGNPVDDAGNFSNHPIVGTQNQVGLVSKCVLFNSVGDGHNIGTVTQFNNASKIWVHFRLKFNFNYVMKGQFYLYNKTYGGVYHSVGNSTGPFVQFFNIASTYGTYSIADLLWEHDPMDLKAAYQNMGNLDVWKWHDIDMFYDGSKTGNSNRLKVYFDGIQESAYSWTGTIPATFFNFTPYEPINSFIGAYNASFYPAYSYVDEVIMSTNFDELNAFTYFNNSRHMNKFWNIEETNESSTNNFGAVIFGFSAIAIGVGVIYKRSRKKY
jgi:hypothetical protein